MEQLDLLRRVVDALESLGIRYAIVGSYASGAWGEPRFTQDIDIALEVSEGQAEELVRAFPLPEYYVSTEAAKQAVRRCRTFNLLHPTSGNKVDFIVVGRDEWERGQMARRQRMTIKGGFSPYFAAAEDVIISKMWYHRQGGSDKHLRDITGMIKVSGEKIDRAYIARWAKDLGLTEIWHTILKRLGEPVE